MRYDLDQTQTDLADARFEAINRVAQERADYEEQAEKRRQRLERKTAAHLGRLDREARNHKERLFVALARSLGLQSLPQNSVLGKGSNGLGILEIPEQPGPKPLPPREVPKVPDALDVVKEAVQALKDTAEQRDQAIEIAKQALAPITPMPANGVPAESLS